MALLTLSGVETWNDVKFQNRSRQLDQFLRGDYSSIADELKKAFPHTTGLQERYVPLVSRYAHELSGLYAKPVIRRFQSFIEPTAVQAFIKMRECYGRSGFDRFMHNVHRKLLIQNTVLVGVLPGGRPGEVRLMCWNPYQVDWEMSRPMYTPDVQELDRVALQMPIDVDDTGVIVFGQIVMTPDEIYLDRGGERVPIYGQTTTNPFDGMIPLVVIRGEDPAPGRFFAPVNEPLLNMAIALSINESDTELLVHTQAWGQRVIVGAQPAQQIEEIRVGPEKVLALVSMDPQAPSPELKVIQGQPPLSQISNWNESRLRLLCSMFDLSPDAFLKVNTAVTASARAYDQRDRDEAKARYEPILNAAEQELARLIARVLNLTDPLQIPSDIRVNITYPTYDPPVDPLHEAQALKEMIALGITSPVDVVANRDGITRRQAIDKIRANLDETAALGLGPIADETETIAVNNDRR